MKCLRILPVLAVILVPGFVPAQLPDPAPGLRVAFLDDAGPLLLGVDARIQGKDVTAAWDEFIDKVFRLWDRDGDGVLDKDEAKQILPATLVFPLYEFSLPREPASADLDSDGKVTRRELAEFYRNSGGAPLQFRWSPGRDAPPVLPFPALSTQANSDTLNKAMLRVLDIDGDGRLSTKELARAASALKHLDTDEDELVTAQEIAPPRWDDAPRPLFLTGTNLATGPLSAFVPTTHDRPDLALSFRLGNRYGTPKAFGLGPKEFAALDRDGNGELSGPELARFGSLRPDVRLKFEIGTPAEPGKVSATVGAGSRVRCTASAGGAVVVETVAARIGFRCDPLPSADEAEAMVSAGYETEFRRVDLFGRGYLTADDAARSNFYGVVFKLLDRDADGKLYLREVADFFDRVREVRRLARGCCFTVAVVEEGRCLFDLLDADRDGKLSPRELRGAPKLLERFDRNGDGRLSLDEIPASHEARLRPGAAQADGGYVVTLRRPDEILRGPAAGPVWFRKMDRNRDGDVSRAEFLGTEADFRRIDADGDGLISAEEADIYDRKLRK